MSSFNKSIFSSNPDKNDKKIYNPVNLENKTNDKNVNILSRDVPLNTFTNTNTDTTTIDETLCDISFLTSDDITYLQMIDISYGSPMANKNYEIIPNDYEKYIEIYTVVQNLQTKTTNDVLLLFLKIVEDVLVGSINSYEIYGTNLMLTLDKTNLQKKIDDILSNKNNINVSVASSTGQMNIVKSFKLATVFNYYIIIYGMPSYGSGFDKSKIAFLIEILKKNGIDPFK
jgi:hypothetical protein